VKIVCISDTHGDHAKVSLPAGDVLIHAGDITAYGTREDYLRFLDWFADQPMKHKIFIAGNHDTFLESDPEAAAAAASSKNVVYLNDSGVTVDGVKIWGSPITPQFHDWSFMRAAGEEIERHWSLIPADTQLLITHGPIWGVLDAVQRSADVIEHTGCPSLAAKISEIKPAYHVFGHIHEAYGESIVHQTTHLNVSTMNMSYKIQNAPVVINID